MCFVNKLQLIFCNIFITGCYDRKRGKLETQEVNTRLSDKITVIVPTLNEEKTLYNTLNLLSLSDNEELIVVDGGSSDGSVSIARKFTDRVFVTTTGKGRGHAMNYGAQRAEGDILLFLHADSSLPDGAFDTVREVMKNRRVAAGAFDIIIDHPGLRFRIIEAGANLRSRGTSIPYGDQGIFMKKDRFHSVGGFEDLPIMEDIAISRKLSKEGKIVFVRPPVKTSPRRWLKEGAVYTTLRDWTIALSYSFLRISPSVLKKYYRDVR